jgi:hypothetical protein
MHMLGGKRQIALERAAQQFAKIGGCTAVFLDTPRIIARWLYPGRSGDLPPSAKSGSGRDRYGRNHAEQQCDLSRLHTVWIAHQPPYLAT